MYKVQHYNMLCCTNALIGVEDKKSEKEDVAQEAVQDNGGLASEGQSEDRAMMIYYRRGVYLNPDATLKDLRNAFLDSGKRICSHQNETPSHIIGLYLRTLVQDNWKETTDYSNS